ncbi:MAG: hypothetical protein LBB07_00260 [Bifidobacteriaceae bacterium]|jgi:ribonuclease-3|nr:hypothetical protein [Bifidobacteriaceae bacterium]
MERAVHAKEFIGGFEEKYNLKLDSVLLVESLTHKSFSDENKEFKSYERLEFLGDSVIGLAVSDYLFSRLYSDEGFRSNKRVYSGERFSSDKKLNSDESSAALDEGAMTQIKANIVSRKALSKKAYDFQLGKLALIGKSLTQNKDDEKQFRGSDKLLGDIFESFMGCIFLSNGYEKTVKFLVELLKGDIEKQIKNADSLQDAKGKLDELLLKRGEGTPQYEYTREGEDHNSVWTAKAKNGEEVLGCGIASNQKDASKIAAEKALEALKE